MMLKEAVWVVFTLFKHNHNSPGEDAIEYLFCSDTTKVKINWNKYIFRAAPVYHSTVPTSMCSQSVMFLSKV